MFKFFSKKAITTKQEKKNVPQYLNEYRAIIGRNVIFVKAPSYFSAQQQVKEMMKAKTPHYDSRYYTENAMPKDKENYRVELLGNPIIFLERERVCLNPEYRR